jgi:hypothetical protein
MQISPHNLLLASQLGARNAQPPAVSAARAPAGQEAGGFAPLSFRQVATEPRPGSRASDEPIPQPGGRLDIRI